MKVSADYIAQIVNGKIIGSETIAVNNFAKIEDAQATDLAFIANPKYVHYLKNNNAGIILINESFESELVLKPTVTYILVEDAYTAFTFLLQQIQAYQNAQNKKTGISKLSAVHESAQVSASTFVDDFTKIDSQAKIGDNCEIYSNVVIGENVTMGNNCIIFPGAKILKDCIVGNNVIIQSNVVIGSDGFGFAPNKEGVYAKIPQMGNVIIHDNVEIGANSTIDRATMGSTIIGEGVKIDNLVQIAHNVTIGAHTVIAAQVGISGSTKIGKRCVIGGQAGIVGHINIADGTKINAQSGVSKTVEIENSRLTGSPAFDYYASIKSQALSRKLPEIIDRIKALENKK